ncbi:MAG: dTMP kinase [Firmicutes bacterium]|nr:dTMP kinase [Bacillota bacterium]
MKGLFITIEGPDGAGKSTQIKLLEKYLNELGYRIVITREPGGTKISEDIRDIILDNENVEMSYETEALLYAASRAQHVHERILPALKEGKIVICDRFIHSSLVYQGVARGLGIKEVRDINEFAIKGVKPDVTLFFDIPPEKALKRKIASDKADRLENEDISFHKKVYKAYLELKKLYPTEIEMIDATKSIEEISKEIERVIKKVIKGRS